MEAILHDQGKKMTARGDKGRFWTATLFFKIYKKTERSDSLLLVIYKVGIENVENEWQLVGRREAAAKRFRSSSILPRLRETQLITTS